MKKNAGRMIHSGLRRMTAALLAVIFAVTMLAPQTTYAATTTSAKTDITVTNPTDSELTVELYADGTTTGKTATISAGSSYTFADMDEKNGDTDIVYSVVESTGKYTANQTDKTAASAEGKDVYVYVDAPDETAATDYLVVLYPYVSSEKGGSIFDSSVTTVTTFSADDTGSKANIKDYNAAAWTKTVNLQHDEITVDGVTYNLYVNASEVTNNSLWTINPLGTVSGDIVEHADFVKKDMALFSIASVISGKYYEPNKNGVLQDSLDTKVQDNSGKFVYNLADSDWTTYDKLLGWGYSKEQIAHMTIFMDHYTFGDQHDYNSDNGFKGLYLFKRVTTGASNGSITFTLESSSEGGSEEVTASRLRVRNFWDEVPEDEQLDTVTYTIYKDGTALAGYEKETVTEADTVSVADAATGQNHDVAWSKEYNLDEGSYSVKEDPTEAAKYTVWYETSKDTAYTYTATAVVKFTPEEYIVATEEKPITITYTVNGTEKTYTITKGEFEANTEYTVELPETFETTESEPENPVEVTKVEYTTVETVYHDLTATVTSTGTGPYLQVVSAYDLDTNKYLVVTYTDEEYEQQTVYFQVSNKVSKNTWTYVQLPSGIDWTSVTSIDLIKTANNEKEASIGGNQELTVWDTEAVYGGYVTTTVTPSVKLEKNKYVSDVVINVGDQEIEVPVSGKIEANQSVSITQFVDVGDADTEMAPYVVRSQYTTNEEETVTKNITIFSSELQTTQTGSEEITVLEIHHAIPTRDITVTEEWVPVEGSTATRPTDVNVTLVAKVNGVEAPEYSQTTVNIADSDYTHTFTGLRVTDDNGNEIVYEAVVKSADDGSYTRVSDKAGDVSVSEYTYTFGAEETELTVTDTPKAPEPETRDITVYETWNCKVEDGRPTDVNVKLIAYVDGTEVAEYDVPADDETVNIADSDYTYTFTGLPVTDADGNVITYVAVITSEDKGSYTRELKNEAGDVQEADVTSSSYEFGPDESSLEIIDTPYFTIVHVKVNDIDSDGNYITENSVTNKVAFDDEKYSEESDTYEYNLLTADGYDRDENDSLYAGQYLDEELSQPLAVSGLEDYCDNALTEDADGDEVEPANAIHPVPGKTYYVKELSRAYLRPRTIQTWWYPDEEQPEVGNQIVEARMLTAIDNENYAEVGFLYPEVEATKDGAAVEDTISSTNTQELAKTVTLDIPYPESSTSGSVGEITSGISSDELEEDDDFTYKVSDMYTINGVFAVCELPVTLPDNPEDPMNDSGNEDAVDYAKYTAHPYFDTLDGVEVTGDTIRYMEYSKDTDDDGNSVSDLYRYQDDSKDSENVTVTVSALLDDTQAGEFNSPLTVVKNFTLMSYHPVTYTVTVVDGDSSTDVTTAGGDVTAQMPANEKAGYIFAGYYADQAYKTPADLTSVSADLTVYAKYVTDDYLAVKYQETKTKNVLTKVKLVAAVDGNNYKEQGFIIEVNGEESTYKCSGLYSQTSGTSVKKIFSNMTNSSRLFYYNLSTKGFADGTTIKVTPYWITKDGTKVTGTGASYTYYQSGLVK